MVDDSLLLDYGMASTTPPSYPVGRVSPDAVVVSHGHLDHAGALPALLSGTDRPEIHWTAPTREFALTLARDTLKLHGHTPRCPFTETDVQRLTQVSHVHDYGEPFEAAGYEVTLYNAGHIPGSAHVLVDSAGRTPAGDRGSASLGDDGDTRLLYTGDFHTDDQRLVPGSTDRPDADVVVCESTYADVTHEPREHVEQRFARQLRDTVAQGGTVVVPAFAIGRTQEVLMLCERYDLDCYVDGMGKDVSRMLRSHPAFLRDPDAFSRAVSHARFVTSNGQRERVAKKNTVVVTTSGMLSVGRTHCRRSRSGRRFGSSRVESRYRSWSNRQRKRPRSRRAV
nr:MBL fold metallo-hydrolase [Halomarina rubra]